MTGVEEDSEEASRVQTAIAARDRGRIATLVGLTKKDSYEREFLGIDPAHYDAVDRALLARLVWHYRHSFPRGIRPTVNPADPIVRESEASYV